MNRNRELAPTRDQPLLVGLLVDVSGSMMSSIQNTSGGNLNRLESFEQSLGQLAANAKDISRSGERGLIQVFAYGFGFGNVLSTFLGGSGPKVQDILRMPGEQEAAIALDVLADNWDRYQAHVRGLAPKMFGDTPMRQGFQEISERFGRERRRRRFLDSSVLFVLSDGEPTDVGNPQEIVTLATALKAEKIDVISCYVTDADITEPRHLYGKAQPTWRNGARLMFDCASILPRPSAFEAYMAENRWKLEPDGRLFTQVNQSEILSEFLSVITSSLEPRTKPQQIASRGAEPLAEVTAPPSDLRDRSTVQVIGATHVTPDLRRGEIDRNRLFSSIAHWTFVTAILIGLIGVVLIAVGGPQGQTTLNLFGQQFQSVSVGIAAIFIAVVMVVLNIRRLLKSVDR